MAKQEDLSISAEQERDFEDEDHVLHYKPKIAWEEPPEEYLTDSTVIPTTNTIEDLKKRTEALVNGYTKVNQIIDQVQQKIDARVKSVGGLDVALDSSVDAATIAAIQRKFPDKDPSKITYDMYKEALKCLNKQANTIPGISTSDLAAAKANPTKTDFGGLGNKPGQNRAEISNPMALKPVDLKKFQKQAVLSLFKLMEPLISNNSKAAVQTHESTKKHG